MTRRTSLRPRLVLPLIALCALLVGAPWFAAPAAADGGLQPTLVVDLDTEAGKGDSSPRNFLYVPSLDLTFFTAVEPTTGLELWRTDGTEVGTQRIGDFCPGPCSFNPRLLATLDGRAYFIADDGAFGDELWSTDGTVEGTSRVVDACPGPCDGALSRRLMEAVVFRERLVFTVLRTDDASVRELWSTDGMPGNASRFLDLDETTCPNRPRMLRPVGNTLYFSCDNNLLATDGTLEGTREIFPQYVYDAQAAGGDLYALRLTEEHGRELWRTDGTPEGTMIVEDLCPGDCSGVWELQGEFNDRVYFNSHPAQELYEADALGMRKTFADETWDVDFADDRLFITVQRPVGNAWRTELWTTTGLGAEQLLLDMDVEYKFERQSAASGDRLFFVREGDLWISDGTSDGTRLLRDLAGEEFFSDFYADGNVFIPTTPGSVGFSTDQGDGLELWMSDGTSDGSRQIADLSKDPGSGDPEKLSPVGDRLVFTNEDEAAEETYVWSTDGTEGGTFLIDQGPQRPLIFHPVDDVERLFYTSFYPFDDAGVGGLWSTDGSETELLVQDLRVVRSMETLPGGKFLLEAATEDDYHSVGTELWVTDLTDLGTEFVAEISPHFGGILAPPRPYWAEVGSSVLLDGRRVFAGGDRYDFSPPSQLWSSDGTTEGTIELLPCPSELEECPRPRELTRVRKRMVVFASSDEVEGRELWRTNGTPEGTRQLVDLLPGAGSSSPHDFAQVRQTRVLFFADDGEGGDDLWRTNGTTEGTAKVANLEIGGLPSYVIDSERVGTRLFFVLVNESAGAELWVTDGTFAGTGLVREIIEGPGDSAVQNLTAWNDLLLFTARDAEHGLELWQTDGTAAGTVRLTDIAPGEASSAPQDLRTVGATIYFTADDGENGRELWKLGSRLQK